MPENHGNSPKTQVALVILGLIGVALVLLSTSLYGVGISPDSTSYISAARSLLSGSGYLRYDGGPFVQWPPLFPTLLAALGLIGIEPLDGARFVNAFIFGFIVFTSGQLFLKRIRSKVLAILGSLSILLSMPLLSVSIMAWTEPLFTLLAILFVLCLSKFLCWKTLPLLFLLAVIAALGCLQRYVGITLILTGFILIAFSMSRVPLRERFKYAIAFGSIGVSPVSIWVIRNYMLTSTLTGSRRPSSYTLYQNIVYTLDVLTKWFLPHEMSLLIGLIGVSLVVSILMAIIVFVRYNLSRRASIGLMQAWSVGTFVLVYTLFVIASSTIVAADRISDRLLVPIYVFVMFLVFIGIESASNWLKVPLTTNILIKLIFIGLCTIWLIYSLAKVSHNVLTWTRSGAGGYSQVIWRESTLMKWLQIHPLDGQIYSNAPDAIYILTGITARMSPNRRTGISQFWESMSLEDNNYFVWFNNNPRNYLYGMQELISMLEFEEVAVLSDGAIYLLEVDEQASPPTAE